MTVATLERTLTLGALLESVWAQLRAEGSAQCPWCGGVMKLRDDAGRCSGCGSALS